MALLFLTYVFFPITAHAQQEKNTIRVAYPIQSGLTAMDEQGDYSGYTYEYLQEIAQYTGWDLEFVRFDGTLDEQLSKSLEAVRTGEVDIMGGIIHNEQLAAVYDYPSYNYGTSYTTLNVLEENTKINETNLKTLDNIRIAIYEKAVNRNAELIEFCEANGLSPEFISFDSMEKVEGAVREGRADAMIGSDLSPVGGMRTVASFAAKPFYLIVTKDNKEIVNGLNAAILKINDTDPYFMTMLYEKYFKKSNEKLYLSDEERAYVQDTEVIRVGVMIGKAPFQYIEGQTGEVKGISIDLLDYIAEATQLQFEIVPVLNYNELMLQIQEGKIDVVAGTRYEYDTAGKYGVALTRPFMTSQSVLVLNKKADNGELIGKRSAVVEGTVLSDEYLKQTDIVWYSSPEECIAAVNNGKVDYTYGDGYVVQYYVNQSRYNNLVLIPQSNQIEKLCLSVVKPADANLLSTLNKAVRSIPAEKMQSIMNSNTIRTQDKITWMEYVESNPWEVLVSVILLAAGVIVLLVIVFRRRTRFGRKAALENERYRQLYDLSNEYIFEYDFERDEMTFSEKSARLFNSEKVVSHYFEHLKLRLGKGYDIGESINKLRKESSIVEDIQVMLPDGSLHWLRIMAKAIYDTEGKPIIAIGKVLDVQQEHEEKEKLLAQAQNDSLTNIYNAASCREKVDEYLEKDDGQKGGALLVMDIDHFKDINDRHGHYAGDQVLIQTASILKSIFREDDMVGRLGGDEFCVFIKGVQTQEMVWKKFEEMREKIRTEIKLEGMVVTVSVGAAFAQKGQDFTEIYQIADVELYNVKERGRDGMKIA